MPNKYQFAFLASFTAVFSALLLLSSFVSTKLAEAGYPISNLILLGLPKQDSSPTSSPMSFDLAKAQEAVKALLPNDLHAVEIPYVGTYDLVAVTSSTTFIITSAVILATAFLAKVLHSGQCHVPVSFARSCSFSPHLIGRTKPLDPNKWKEFPLEKVTKVSPNTAMYVSAPQIK